MRPFHLRATGEKVRNRGNIVTGERIEGPDDPDVAVTVYEGPHGPASVAYYDGQERTRVWGPSLPDSTIADGPTPRWSGRTSERLADGLPGTIGGTPLTVRSSPGLLRRSRTADFLLGDRCYTLALRGWARRHGVLLRPDGAHVATIHFGTGELADGATPEEVVLVILATANGYGDDLLMRL